MISTHILVWSDHITNKLPGTHYFDCSELTWASGLESQMLVDYLHLKGLFLEYNSLQTVLQYGCEQFNDLVIDYAQSVTDRIVQTRKFLHDLTGPVGEAVYKKWYESFKTGF